LEWLSLKVLAARAYVTSDSDAYVQFQRILTAKAELNSLGYAAFLAENRVKFLLIDTAMIDGVKSDPLLWLQMLSNDANFIQAWHEETSTSSRIRSLSDAF
jgi:hypothetical protein